MSFRTLKSDDFHFLTIQGWDFVKSKFKIKFNKKFDNFFFLFFLKHDFFLYFPNMGPLYQFSKKTENRPPLNCQCPVHFIHGFVFVEEVLAKNIDYRQQVIRDLLEKEQEFVSDLRSLLNQFLQPLHHADM